MFRFVGCLACCLHWFGCPILMVVFCCCYGVLSGLVCLVRGGCDACGWGALVLLVLSCVGWLCGLWLWCKHSCLLFALFVWFWVWFGFGGLVGWFGAVVGGGWWVPVAGFRGWGIRF